MPLDADGGTDVDEDGTAACERGGAAVAACREDDASFPMIKLTADLLKNNKPKKLSTNNQIR
jgi:hypothetical protein